MSMNEQAQAEWLKKAQKLSKETQAILGLVMLMEEIGNSKVERAIKVDAYVKVLEFHDAYIQRETLRKVISSDTDGIEIIPKEAQGAFASFLLVLAEISEQNDLKKLKDQLIAMQSILK